MPGWYTQHASEAEAIEVHVLPIKDLREHIETRDCWCMPRLETVEAAPPKAFVIIHNAADGRELVERHGIN